MAFLCPAFRVSTFHEFVRHCGENISPQKPAERASARLLRWKITNKNLLLFLFLIVLCWHGCNPAQPRDFWQSRRECLCVLSERLANAEALHREQMAPHYFSALACTLSLSLSLSLAVPGVCLCLQVTSPFCFSLFFSHSVFCVTLYFIKAVKDSSILHQGNLQLLSTAKQWSRIFLLIVSSLEALKQTADIYTLSSQSITNITLVNLSIVAPNAVIQYVISSQVDNRLSGN